MARKPLIPAGSYLGGRDESAAPPDLIANVIARDRERSGRSAPVSNTPEPEEESPTPVVTTLEPESEPETPPIETVAEIPVRTRVMEPEPRVAAAEKTAPKMTKRTYTVSAPPAPAADPKAAAWKAARRRAASNSLPITLRAPEDLNDYLDQLAHEMRKHKVKKQELVSLAIQLLYVEAETGTDILSLLGRRRAYDFDEDDE